MVTIEFCREEIRGRIRNAGDIADVPIAIEADGEQIGTLLSQDGHFTVFIWPFLDVGLSSFAKLRSGQVVEFELELATVIFEPADASVKIYLRDELEDESGESITVPIQEFAVAMIEFAEAFVGLCREEDLVADESTLQWIDEETAAARSWYARTYSNQLD